MAPISPVRVYPWTYVGEKIMVGNDASQAIAIPAHADTVELDVEGGVAYYVVNGTPASPSSGGYVPEDQGRIAGPLRNLNSLAVYAASGVTVHFQFFKSD